MAIQSRPHSEPKPKVHAHPMAEVAELNSPELPPKRGEGVSPHPAKVHALVASMAGMETVDVLAALDAVALKDPDLAQQGLIAWGTDRKVDGNLDLTEHGWIRKLPGGLVVRGNLLLEGVGSVREGMSQDGLCMWQGAQITVVPQVVRVGPPRQREVRTSRVEGSERRRG